MTLRLTLPKSHQEMVFQGAAGGGSGFNQGLMAAAGGGYGFNQELMTVYGVERKISLLHSVWVVPIQYISFWVVQGPCQFPSSHGPGAARALELLRRQG